MSIEQVECEGASALSRLEELRSQFPSTKRYPFIAGDREALEELIERAEDDEREPAGILAESLSVDVPAWFARRKSEAAEDGLDLEEVAGEWAGEAEEKEGITSHLDMLSGAVRPLVSIGLATVEQPWMLPAVLKYGGWNECPDAAIQCAVMRRWQEKYGAEIVCVTGDVIECVVRNPPTTAEASIELAWEQYWYCGDIVDQGTLTVANLASGLMNSNHWFFWWD